MAPTDLEGRADTSFLGAAEADALRTPPSEGAFVVLRELTALTHGKVWLVSKAGPRIQGLTRRWLEHWRVYETTGLPRDHVRFCLQRRDKATHAVELRLSHFIDDRLDVLGHLRGIVAWLYLYGHQRPGTIPPAWATPVLSWGEVRRTLVEHP
jgi:hypothetical protein